MVDLPDGTHWYGVIQCIEELDINSDGNVQVCAGLEMVCAGLKIVSMWDVMVCTGLNMLTCRFSNGM